MLWCYTSLEKAMVCLSGQMVCVCITLKALECDINVFFKFHNLKFHYVLGCPQGYNFLGNSCTGMYVYNISVSTTKCPTL